MEQFHPQEAMDKSNKQTNTHRNITTTKNNNHTRKQTKQTTIQQQPDMNNKTKPQ